MGRRRGKRLVKPESVATPSLSAEQKLLLLDTWRRSGLPAGDFAGLIWAMPANGSACLSIITTSSGFTVAARGWCRPIAFLERRRK